MSNEIDNLQKIRERLADTQGKKYWRCLEELADSEAFTQLLREEYPRQASALTDSRIPRSLHRFVCAKVKSFI